MEKLSKKELFNKLKNCISENQCTIKRDYDEEIKYSESLLLNSLKNEMDYIYSCYEQIIKNPEILELTDWDYDKDTKDIEKDLLEAEFKTKGKILTFTFKYGKLLVFDVRLEYLNNYYEVHFHYLYRL